MIIYIFTWDLDYYFSAFDNLIEYFKQKYENVFIFKKNNYTLTYDKIEKDLLKNEEIIAIELFAEIDLKVWEYKNIKKLLIHDDIHGCDSGEYACGSKLNYINYINKYDYYLGTYSYLFRDILFKNCKTSIYQLYHHYNKKYQGPNINIDDKINKLLIVGTITHDYKLREILFNYENMFLEKCSTTNKKLTQYEFYNKINQYLYVFTDGPINDKYKWRKYLVSKFFEIIFNKSVLVTTKNMIPELEKLGLYENLHFLTIDINNIESSIEYIKSIDKDNASQIIENAYKVIVNEHSIENRFQLIDDILIDNFYEVNIPNYTCFKMKLNNIDTDWVSKNINNYKCWEPNVTNLMLNIVKNNNISLFCDIGCNLGYYSLLLAPFVNNIKSFDILYNQINNLNISISKNIYYNIETNLLGIANKKDYYLINNIDINNIGGTSLTENLNNCIKIKTDKMDNIFTDTIIDLVKIDVEGFEINVLEGATKLLEKNLIKRLIIELTIRYNKEGNPEYDNSKKIIEKLLEYNYKIYNIGLVEQNPDWNFSENFYDEVKKYPIFNFSHLLTTDRPFWSKCDNNWQTNLLAEI